MAKKPIQPAGSGIEDLSDRQIDRVTRRREIAKAHRARVGLAEDYGDSWSASEDKLLRTNFDTAIGHLLGRSRTCVQKRRLRLGISAFRPRQNWSASEDRLLGTLPDREVARLLKRSRMSVQTRRLNLGLHYPAAEFKKWTLQETKLLGKFSDREVSRRVKRSALAVRAMRLKLCGPQNPPSRRWRSEEIQSLGTAADRVIGERFGRTFAAVQHKRLKLGIVSALERAGARKWSPDQDRMLGKHSDRELVRLWKCSPVTIRKRRQALGIPSHRPQFPLWTTREDKLLRELSVKESARRTGRTVFAVLSRRRLLGIRRWQRKRRTHKFSAP